MPNLQYSASDPYELQALNTKVTKELLALFEGVAEVNISTEKVLPYLRRLDEGFDYLNGGDTLQTLVHLLHTQAGSIDILTKQAHENEHMMQQMAKDLKRVTIVVCVVTLSLFFLHFLNAWPLRKP